MDDEIQDIVDEGDNVVGKETRHNIWKKGLEHNVRVVNVFISTSEAKILVPKRAMNKKTWPGRYDFSCGENVLSGETYEEAAQRGLLEELGIKNIELESLGKLTPRNGVSCFMMIFKAVYSGKISEFDKAEVSKVYWLSLDEIGTLLESNPEKFKRDYKEVFKAFSSRLAS